MNDVGLVLVEDPQVPDHFLAAVVHGLEEYLVPAGMRLATRVVATAQDELDVYRSWRRTGAVDAVVLLRAAKGDGRLPVLRRIGLPFVVATDVQRANGFSAVVFDNAAMGDEIVRFLLARGYERIRYLPGPDGKDLSRLRGTAFRHDGPASDLAISDVELEPGRVVAMAQELADGGRVALVFDDDEPAVAAITALQAAGVRVPEDVGVLSWIDSALCQSSEPPVTAMNARADEVGALLGECLLEAARSEVPVVLTAPGPFMVDRASA